MMKKRALGRAALTMVLALCGIAVIERTSFSADGSGDETYRQFDLFGDVFERVRAKYVDQVGDEEMIEAAINGMLNHLDPHSSYLPPKDYTDMQVQTRGEFGGLGIEVTMENGLVKVISPIDDTPASRAGILTGDFIAKLDGTEVRGLNLSEAVDRMRGPVDTDIVLTVVRPGVDRPFDVKLRRAIIRIQSVKARREGDVAYIRITTFSEKTDEAAQQAFERLRGEIGPRKLQGLVLDLRNNSGGLLSQAIGVTDLFLDRGEIVSTRGRSPEDTERFNARSGDIAAGLPVVVMINGGSASASEIVAGALQDHRRGSVLGTRSFGKGSVQTVIPLANQGALRMTTARYYTPSGNSIQARGILPDIEVIQKAPEGAEYVPLRREADLAFHLTGGDGKTDEDIGNSEISYEVIPDDLKDDGQLRRALDLLRGVNLAGAGSGG